MRYWILPVALCACASRPGATPDPAAGSDLNLVTTFPGPSVASAPTVLDEWFATARKPTKKKKRAAPRVEDRAPAAAPAPADAVSERAALILARPDLAAYHGWVRYLSFRAAHAGERHPDNPGAVMEARLKLAHWTERILSDAKAIEGLRGVVEWAYLSPVDDSGQPFVLNVPKDYDASRPAPLWIRLHGEAEDHLERRSEMQPHDGYFELSVLGRARAGDYRALSEADVLQALDYVTEHWAVDRRRVHLVDGGADGADALRLAQRHPDRFASSRPACPPPSDQPLALGNATSFLANDEAQPLPGARGPLGMIVPGGRVEVAERRDRESSACGLPVSNAPSVGVLAGPASPDPRRVAHIDYMATDGSAVGAYLAEISECGGEARAARFALQVRSHNRLEARLENVHSLRLALGDSPIELDRPLRVHVKGSAPFTVPAPLPRELWLEREGQAWTHSSEAPFRPFRLHTPGGANQLYDGTPLLIVHGTGGDEATQNALRSAAELASRSPSARWPAASESGSDGVPHNQNLFGQLEVKADADVSDDDLASHHLVLLGTAEQNSVVARLTERLPARYSGATIEWSDGTRLDASDRALALVHYNPVAPGRLVLWVASDDPAAYAAGSLAPELLGAPPSGADAVVVQVSDPSLVATRSFDSRWHWLP